MQLIKAKGFSRDFDKLHSKHRDLDNTLEEEIRTSKSPESTLGRD